MPIETLNNHAVAVGTWPRTIPELACQEAIVMLNPPQPGALLTKEAALRLAAWLVALADGPALNDEGETLEGSARTRFDQVLEAIQNT